MSIPFLVKDINPGSGSSRPSGLTAVGDTLYFGANDGINGRELWKSDGTAEGTVLVKDIRPGSGSSNPGSLTAVGDTLYFSASNGINNRELWKSDGTAEGTVLFKDIRPGFDSSIPSYLTAVGDTLYFSADDGIYGRELWKSDGTADGTVLVQDIRSGSSGSSPSFLMAVGDTLYFRASDGINGDELWALNVNEEPSALNLINTTTELAENTEIGDGIKVADITVTDDALGENNLTVTGADASDFEIQGNGLFYIGASPNFEIKNSYEVTVNVQDLSLGNEVFASSNFSLTIIDDVNEALELIINNKGNNQTTEIKPYSV